eukprot:4220329-Pleurochrysis_carterae.AAC.1
MLHAKSSSLHVGRATIHRPHSGAIVAASRWLPPHQTARCARRSAQIAREQASIHIGCPRRQHWSSRSHSGGARSSGPAYGDVPRAAPRISWPLREPKPPTEGAR